MKDNNTIIIDTNSKSFKVAREFGRLNMWDLSDGSMDSCTFNRAVIIGYLWLSLLGAAAIISGIFVTISTGNALAWLVVGIQYGFTPLDEIGILSVVLVVLASIVGVVVGLGMGLSKIKSKVAAKVTFKSELYESFKHKYCKKVMLPKHVGYH